MSTSKVSQADMYLVYSDENGKLYYQPWKDVQYVGGLIDPDTGDDMVIVGWSLTDEWE